MKTLLPVALLFFRQVGAHNRPWRLNRREVGSNNDTASFSNSSSTSFVVGSSAKSPSSASFEPSLSSVVAQSTPTTPTPTTNKSNTPTYIVVEPSGTSDVRPTDLPDNQIGADDHCGSTVTYHGSVYPTVYMTVTETFDVTLSAANASMTESETLITPPQACKSTVVPIAPDGVFTIQETVLFTVTDESSAISSTFSTITPTVNASFTFQHGRPRPTAESDNGLASPDPDAPEELSPPKMSASLIRSTVYSGVPYTSTVIITKKTPVPVVPQTIEAPPVFQDPSSQNRPQNPANPPSGDNNRPGQAAEPAPDLQGPINSLVQPTPGPIDVINSLIVSILLPGTVTRPAAQTTIANVPIAVRPSSVIIGTSVVAIPVAGAEAVVSQSGVEFIVRPNEIAAATTTIRFGPLSPLAGTPINLAPTRVTAAPGVVVEVAGSTAVVAGTTYRIRDDFSTIITVSGQRISIGPSGIGLPSTTIVPARATGATISSVDGITYTLSGSNVIISGTRYGVATDSPTITTEINGENISIGPGGIGFPSTTILPTTSEATSTSTSTSSTAEPANTSSGGSENGSGPAVSISVASVFAAALGLAILL